MGIAIITVYCAGAFKRGAVPKEGSHPTGKEEESRRERQRAEGSQTGRGRESSAWQRARGSTRESRSWRSDPKQEPMEEAKGTC